VLYESFDAEFVKPTVGTLFNNKEMLIETDKIMRKKQSQNLLQTVCDFIKCLLSLKYMKILIRIKPMLIKLISIIVSIEMKLKKKLNAKIILGKNLNFDFPNS
jgi:hypothetical protein